MLKESHSKNVFPGERGDINSQPMAGNSPVPLSPRDRYAGTSLGQLMEVCGGCDKSYCFFGQWLNEVGFQGARDPASLFDSGLCENLQEAWLRLPIDQETAFRRRLVADLAYNMGLSLGRRPEPSEVRTLWDKDYESRFSSAYSNGIRSLTDLRREVFPGKN